MPRDAAKVRPPGGRRLGGAEVERRLQLVEELLADGRTRSEVVAECRRQFNMAARTADDYVARVRERWAADAAESRPAEREQTTARLRRLARKLETEGAWSPLVNVERLIADVRGVRAPSRVELNANAEVNVALPSMNDAIRDIARTVSLFALTIQEFWKAGELRPEAARELRASCAHALDLLEGRPGTGGIGVPFNDPTGAQLAAEREQHEAGRLAFLAWVNGGEAGKGTNGVH